jgi:hypothetical protein
MQASVEVVGGNKLIIESIATSGLPPEEVLRRLNSYGIDWYLTEKGDLLIRYWQIGAEDFVPPERIAEIRETQAVPRDANALEWLSTHLAELKGQFSDRWVAIIKNQVVSHAESLPALMEKIHDAQINDPFITFIPGQPIVWATAYGNQTL